MSRKVIRDIVIPVVERIMRERRLIIGYGRPRVQDSNLEEFLEEEMRRRFGVMGAHECQHLREQLEQAMKNDPYAFEFTIRQLLNRYVKLAVKLRCAGKLKRLEDGPPDRFLELRRRRFLRRYYG